MNKKLLLGALLVMGTGAMFTGCVDDTESASVTAVRNAKAEQIKALADLHKANAEAALILANAEKNAKDAEAAYNQALADYNKALAAYQEAQTEAEKQKLAITLEQMQTVLDSAKAQLQRTLASLDADIARYKYEALDYQQQYDKLLAGAEQQEATKLKGLIDNFNTASKTLIEAKKNLAKANMNLTRLETHRVNAKEYLENEIADLKEENDGYQADIAKQQAIIDTYTAYAGKEVTEQDVQAAHVKLIEATNTYDAANTAWADAGIAQSDALSSLQNSDYALTDAKWFIYDWTYVYTKNYPEDYYLNIYYWYCETIPAPSSEYENIFGLKGGFQANYREADEIDGSSHDYQMGIYYISQYNNPTVPKASLGKWNVVIYAPNHQVTYIPVFDVVEEKYDNIIDYTIGDENKTASYRTYTTYLNLIDNGKGLEELASYMDKVYGTENFNKQLDTLNKQLEDLQKAEATAQTKFDTADKAYNDAVAAEKTAKEAYEAAEAIASKDDATEAQKTDRDNKLTAYTTAQQTTQQKDQERQTTYAALKAAKTAVNDCKAQVNTAQAAAENQSQAVASFKEHVATVIASAKENEANIAAYNEASEKDANAYVAYAQAENEKNILDGEYKALYDALHIYGGILEGSGDANNAIANANAEIERLNSLIETNEGTIKDKEEELAKLDTIDGQHQDQYGQFYDDLIEEAKAQIASYQADVDAAQQKYDMAKAELDAAVESK